MHDDDFDDGDDEKKANQFIYVGDPDPPDYTTMNRWLVAIIVVGALLALGGIVYYAGVTHQEIPGNQMTNGG